MRLYVETKFILGLARSRPYSESPAEFRKLMALLVHSGEEESARLNEALGMLLGSTILIPLDSPTARSALALQESRGLSPQDSIVFASILSDLSGDPPEGPHGFATKDTDFLTPDVRGDLAALDCRLFTRFNHGLSYYRSRA